MSFLLDTDICSAQLRAHRGVQSRFLQHTGGLRISTITLGELYAWTLRPRTAVARAAGLTVLLGDVEVLDVTPDVAREFGRLRAHLLDRGLPMPPLDLVNAAVALTHDLTLVTHNTKDYINVPGLRLADWLA